MGRKQGGGQPKCWLCGEKGHVQTLCPRALSNEVTKSCFICGSSDHLSAACDQRKVEECGTIRPWPRVERVVTSDRQQQTPCGCAARMSVLITSSPVPSHPSTMMIEAVLASFARVQGLMECPLIIVLDGYKFSGKSTWKAGRVTEDSALRYKEYVKNLEQLLESGVLPAGTKLVILDGHNGQAMAVKAGLAEVQTPFVCVHQHDLEFPFDFNLATVLDVLEDETNSVRYVGMPLLTNLHYEAIAWQHHGLHVEVEAYRSLQLMPVVFWYDSTHITSVEHYQNLVFGPEEVYTPGNFVEETFGVRQRQDIMSKGMAAHPKYGTYHCVSTDGMGERRPLICHLNGVRFLTPQQREERGYPADPPVEFFPSRVMMNKKQRKVKRILDLVLSFAGVESSQAGKVRDVLAKELNETRIRVSPPASQCLPSTSEPDCFLR